MQMDHRYPGLPEQDDWVEAQAEDWVAEQPVKPDSATSRARVLTAMFLGALCTGLVSLVLSGGFSAPNTGDGVADSSALEAQTQTPVPEGEVSRRLREKTAAVAAHEKATEDTQAQVVAQASAPSPAGQAKADTKVTSVDYMAQTGNVPNTEGGAMANLLRAMDTLEGGKDD